MERVAKDVINFGRANRAQLPPVYANSPARYKCPPCKHSGTGLETAIFHAPMRVAPDVISQHFHTNLLRAILVPNKTIFSKREQEVMDKMYRRLK